MKDTKTKSEQIFNRPPRRTTFLGPMVGKLPTFSGSGGPTTYTKSVINNNENKTLTITNVKNGTSQTPYTVNYVDEWDTAPTANHGIGHAVTSEGIKTYVDNAVQMEAASRQQMDENLLSTLGEAYSRITTNTNAITAETQARQQADTELGDDIDDINSKIPAQATSTNQLADKNFVNSSIATNTANFIGTFNSVAELEAYSGPLTNNDYAFVVVTDASGNIFYNRYKYNQAWIFEYELNNSSFTASQWAAINSNATTTNIAQIATNTNDIANNTANIALKQNITDNSLTTTDKTIPGAINELNSGKLDNFLGASTFGKFLFVQPNGNVNRSIVAVNPMDAFGGISKWSNGEGPVSVVPTLYQQTMIVNDHVNYEFTYTSPNNCRILSYRIVVGEGWNFTTVNEYQRTLTHNTQNDTLNVKFGVRTDRPNNEMYVTLQVWYL